MNKNFKWYLVIFISVIFLGYFVMGMVRNAEDLDTSNGLLPENPLVTDKNEDKDKNEDENEDKDEDEDEDEDINLNSLPIPEILENKSNEKGKAEFDLEVNYGKKEFIDGYKADTLGYNGDYLGPVIKVNKGDEVKINVENKLNEETTVHWHGLEVPAEMDGGPHQIINPGSSWKPYFTINQQASTLWYHPHIMGTTGEQVYKGLAGLFFIEDDISKSLDIPKEYGVNDIPLVVQDKRFTREGDIPYNLNMRDLMDGFLGDTVLINGAIEPQLDVKNEMLRLRFLNGSNGRNYLFRFSGNKEFYQIASDGGFLEKAVELRELFLALGERAEILMNLPY